MRTTSGSRNTIAQPMVMRSRFFSTILVPVWEEYTELAIISEMPVPFPECRRMKMMKTQAGDDQQGDEDDQKRIHVMLFHSKITTYASNQV